MLQKPENTESNRRSSNNSFHSQTHRMSPFTTKMCLSYIFGTNSNPSTSSNIYAYKKQHLIFYVKNMFVKFSIATKKYSIDYEEGQNPKSEQNFQDIIQEPKEIDAVKEDDDALISNQINSSVLVVSKHFPGPNGLFVIIKKIEDCHYLSLYWTQSNKPASLLKISEDPKQTFINVSYHAKKGYIYLLYKNNAASNPQKQGDRIQKNQRQNFLKIIEIHSPVCSTVKSTSSLSNPSTCFKASPLKFKVLLNCCIRRTGGRFQELNDLIVGEDHCELYMFGLDYFRLWTVLYNQKTIKQSNYRNIQRNIKKQKILEVMWISDIGFNKSQEKPMSSLHRPSIQSTKQDHNYLAIITTVEVLFVRNNELIHITSIPSMSPFLQANRDNAQFILEKSLNQLYKTKYQIDGVDTIENQVQSNSEDKSCNNHQEVSEKLISTSKVWVQTVGGGRSFGKNYHLHGEPGGEKSQLKIKEYEQQNHKDKEKHQKSLKFCGALENGNIFYFKINPDFSIKIQNSIASFTQLSEMEASADISRILNISASCQGTLILLTDSRRHVYINNRLQDLENTEVYSLYIGGHCHASSIRSLSCPEIMNFLVSVSDDGSLKVWNKSEKDRHIAIDEKFKLRPVSALIHQSGFFVVVNFGFEIKVFAIVSNDLEEIAAVKVHDFCSYIELSKTNNFLIANQKTSIKFYDPFTLHLLGKLESQDMRLQYRKMMCSQNGQYMIFQCCNNKIYQCPINSIFHPRQKKEFYETETKPQQPQFCHRQSQQYTCFHFNFGTLKSNTLMQLEKQSHRKSLVLSASNIFIGFTKTKFMTVYSNFAQDLVAEFPVIHGMYVTDCCFGEDLIFVGTNKGTIRTYKWPMLENHFEVIATDERTAEGCRIGKLKPPVYLKQFSVWRDHSPITTMLKMPNNQEIVVGATDGVIGFVKYVTWKNCNQIFHGQSGPIFSGERKKIMETIDNLKLVKVAQIQKISKLIQKTEHDIQKLEIQLQNQKQRKIRQLQRKQEQLKNNSNKKRRVYINQRSQKFIQLESQLKQNEKQYNLTKYQLTKQLNQYDKQCKKKIQYQKWRIHQIHMQLENQKNLYKDNIIKLMEQHKSKIRDAKDENLKFLRKLEEEFEKKVKNQYGEEANIEDIQEVTEEQLIQNQRINVQSIKVQELKSSIQEKKRQLSKMEQKVKEAKREDEDVQKIFQKNLEKFNQSRYDNLVLHSQLLKIQNQLYERKQILAKKDEIISIAFHEKETNETFKQFVSGAICGLEDQKGKVYDEYVEKQANLAMLFDQLTLEINKSNSKKLKIVELDHMIKIFEKEKSDKEKKIRASIGQLKELKKYLLVQGTSDGCENKKIYQEQQKLLTTIRWLQKRFRMNSVNEKKLTVLKKSTLKQVINQNKNLLEECNQLRQQGIIYQNEIDHLSRKLAQANQIIQYDQKVRNQSNILSKQSEQLNQIRQYIKAEIQGINDGDQIEETL